jgi:hypothetical protein
LRCIFHLPKRQAEAQVKKGQLKIISVDLTADCCPLRVVHDSSSYTTSKPEMGSVRFTNLERTGNL